jgi:hypothetical protein
MTDAGPVICRIRALCSRTERPDSKVHEGARLLPGRSSAMLRFMKRCLLILLPGLVIATTQASPAYTAYANHDTRGPMTAFFVTQQPDEQGAREEAAREILMGAKDALASGNVTFLRNHLGQRVYLNLFTGTNGYYSRHQAYMILQSFFSAWPPISFSFSSRNFSTANPYGFGPLTYERRGRRGVAELFLSLTMIDDRWVINQVTISTR